MPSPLPTRNTDAVIGPRKDRLGGPGPRLYTISPEDWNRAVDHLFSIFEEIGETDGSTPGSLWEAISALGGGEIAALTFNEQGSAPAAVANKVKVYAKDVGGTSALFARTDDGVEHELTAATGAADWPVTTITGSSATLSAESQIVECITAATCLVTLPAPAEGLRFIFRSEPDGTAITLRPHDTSGSGPSIAGGAAGDDYVLGTGNAWSLYSDGSDWWRSDYETPVTPTTSAAVWTVEESVSAPSSAADSAKLYALDVSGRTEPSIILSDGIVVPLVAVPTRSESAGFTFNQRDEAVFVTANTLNATLPAARAGRQYAVIKTHTGANAITIVRAGSEQIQGSASNYVLPGSGDAARGRWALICDGTNWWVF